MLCETALLTFIVAVFFFVDITLTLSFDRARREVYFLLFVRLLNISDSCNGIY